MFRAEGLSPTRRRRGASDHAATTARPQGAAGVSVVYWTRRASITQGFGGPIPPSFDSMDDVRRYPPGGGGPPAGYSPTSSTSAGGANGASTHSSRVAAHQGEAWSNSPLHRRPPDEDRCMVAAGGTPMISRARRPTRPLFTSSKCSTSLDPRPRPGRQEPNPTITATRCLPPRQGLGGPLRISPLWPCTSPGVLRHGGCGVPAMRQSGRRRRHGSARRRHRRHRKVFDFRWTWCGARAPTRTTAQHQAVSGPSPACRGKASAARPVLGAVQSAR